MDEELRALVKKFQDLQQDEGVRKVNERNVVEIIQILQKKYNIELIYTTDGKEYLTTAQLKSEIENEIYTAGGRINICDLPSLLNVDITHVERLMPSVQQSDPTAIVLEGEIITSLFLQSVLDEAVQSLKECGKLVISDLAKLVRLPSTFIIDFLRNAIQDGKIVALTDDSTLYTPQFVAAQKSLIFCSFAALTKPTSLLAFVQRHQIYPGLFSVIIRSLLDQQLIHGHIDGDLSNGRFVPSAYEQSRLDAMHRSYVGNGYVSYSSLAGNDIDNPKAFMISRYNPPQESMKSSRKQAKGKKGANADSIDNNLQYPHRGIPLSACFISLKTLSELDGIAQLLQQKVMSYNVFVDLPASADPVADVDAILEILQQEVPQLEERCVVLSDATFVQRSLFTELLPGVEYVAREDFAAHVKKGSVAKVDIAEVPRNERKLLLLLCKSLNWQISESEKLLDELYSFWEPHLRKVYASVRDVLAAGSPSLSEAKKVRQMNDEAVVNLYQELRQYGKSIASYVTQQLPNHDAAIQKHILSSFAPRIGRGLFLDAAVDYPQLIGKIADVCEEDLSLDANAPLSKLKLKDFAGEFPSNHRESLKKIFDFMAQTQSSIPNFVSELEQMSAERSTTICMRPPGKKQDRELFDFYLQKLVRAVSCFTFVDSTDPAQVNENAAQFSMLLSLAVAKQHHALVLFPGKVIADVLNCVDVLNTELKEGQMLIVELLSKKGEGVQLSAKLNSLRDQILALTPE